MKFHFGILAMSLIAIGCDKNDGASTASGTVSSTPFLTAADFTSTKEKNVDAASLAGEMDDLDGLWANSPDTDTSNTDSSEDAINECLNPSAIIENKETAIFAMDEDIAPCIQKFMEASTKTTSTKVSKMTVRFLVRLTCAGADLSSAVGKKMSEVTADSSLGCETSTKGILIINAKVEVAATTTIDATTIPFSSSLTLATMTSDGLACEKNLAGNELTLVDGCGEYSKVNTKLTLGTITVDEDDVSKVVFTGIREVNDTTSKFYKAGTAAVYLNGWNGTVTYSGADISPTWSMTKNGDTQTGTITVTESLSLDEATTPMVKGFNRAVGKTMKSFLH